MMNISPRRRSVSRHGRAEPLLVLAFGLFSLLCHTGSADIVISEISDQGSSSACGDKDWLELYNTATVNTTHNISAAVDLSGYILHDDQGVNDTDAYTFPQGQQLAPGEYLVLCTEGSDPLTSLQFKIGGSDTLTLFNPATQEIVASVGPLPDGAERAFDVTYAWNNADMTSNISSLSYVYTSTPTPGQANILTPIMNVTA